MIQRNLHSDFLQNGLMLKTGINPKKLGYNIITPSVVIATHLTQLIKKNADMLLTRQAVQSLIETLKGSSPVIVDELIPDVLPIGVVQKVLQLLLKEGVPIRNLEQIFEALADNAPRTRKPHETC